MTFRISFLEKNWVLKGGRSVGALWERDQLTPSGTPRRFSKHCSTIYRRLFVASQTGLTHGLPQMPCPAARDGSASALTRRPLADGAPRQLKSTSSLNPIVKNALTVLVYRERDFEQVRSSNTILSQSAQFRVK